MSLTAPCDDILWLAILFSGFNALHRLGDLVWPDTAIPFSSLRWSTTPRRSYSYTLPGHKGNRYFEGNIILVTEREDGANAVPIMKKYTALRSANAKTRFHPALFVRENGAVPTRSWFMRRLRANFDASIAGHSICSGGATDLALRGVPDSSIQKIGRWASDSFQIYIRKHPALLAVLAGLLPR